MSSPRKKILVAGLGRFITADPNAAARFGPIPINKQLYADVPISPTTNNPLDIHH